MEKDRHLFRLHLAMGWASFIAIPVSCVLAFVDPVAAAGLVPANALAFWNWRRMLSRGAGDVLPTTKASEPRP